MTNRATIDALSPTREHGTVKSDHPMLAGHFPGHPIVPGAWLLAWVVAAATRRLAAGTESRFVLSIKRVKFLRPLPPDQPFECTLNLRAPAGTQSDGHETMRFAVTGDGGLIAEGSLLCSPEEAGSAR